MGVTQVLIRFIQDLFLECVTKKERQTNARRVDAWLKYKFYLCEDTARINNKGGVGVKVYRERRLR
jgi:hypothetical protein